MKHQAFFLVLLIAMTLLSFGFSTFFTLAEQDVNPAIIFPAQPEPRSQDVSSNLQTAQPTIVPDRQLAKFDGQAARQLSKTADNQEQVTVTVRPLNLAGSEETLKFEVSMDTHAVDLNMDLAASASLIADNGDTVQAILWDAPRGGRHVTGTLVFPASLNGKPLLQGVKKLTLTIKNVAATERVFTWILV